MASPSAGAYEYTELFVPTGEEPTNHWYVGEVPPFVGVAVNVTLVFSHIAPETPEAIFTLAVRVGLTIIVITFETAGEPVTQVSFDCK